MKTLVIHPKDITTDFLKGIYYNKSWTVVNDPKIKREELIEEIEGHDRIFMMGHGSPQGLFGGDGMLIDQNLVPLLKQKITMFIWCHADKFVNKYSLKGFYTGMFVSEEEEALYCNIPGSTDEQIEYSNTLFAETVNRFIDVDNILGNVKALYNNKEDGNIIIEYNRSRLYFNK